MNDTLKIINSKNVVKSLKEGKRIDGRKLDEFRNIEIKKDVIDLADGSAWVKLGETEVLAGVKFVVGEPFPDSEDQGSMSLNLELSGLSSPDYFTGPPQIDAIEYGRVADRAIRHSGALDFKKLCLKKGEKVFIVFIDCIAINASGNLIDATVLAAISALKNAKIPKLDEEFNILKEPSEQKLEINKIPLSFTFEKIANKIILDADFDEEQASDARFSLGISKDDIISCQKGKKDTFTEKEIFEMIDSATKKYDEILKKI